MAANPLIGTWRLVSWESHTADGKVGYPLGRDAMGYIIYTAEARMMVTMMAADRPQMPSGDSLAGTPVEKAAAYDTYNSYSGTYEFQGDKVIHHVDLSLIPNRVGTDQVRAVALDGDRVTLTTPPMLRLGEWQTNRLVWERVVAG